MIYLLVDECYAFDYLSILEIKKQFSEQHENAWRNCCSNLITQLPVDFDKIINSQEYKQLVESNKKTFDAVEKARYGHITAKEVDDCNMDRYHKKIALQSKFFGNMIVEKKT
jgi:hypothetical protein